jgi:hypothetical protein
VYVIASVFCVIVALIAFTPPANVPGGIVAGIVAVLFAGLEIWQRVTRKSDFSERG